MARKRFNAEEKTLLVAGTPVEWQNGTQWHPGTILSGLIVDDVTGSQYAELRNHAVTRTLWRGDDFRATPGKIRRPAITPVDPN
jgi:hypothetical protein